MWANFCVKVKQIHWVAIYPTCRVEMFLYTFRTILYGIYLIHTANREASIGALNWTEEADWILTVWTCFIHLFIATGRFWCHVPWRNSFVQPIVNSTGICASPCPCMINASCVCLNMFLPIIIWWWVRTYSNSSNIQI